MPYAASAALPGLSLMNKEACSLSSFQRKVASSKARSVSALRSFFLCSGKFAYL